MNTRENKTNSQSEAFQAGNKKERKKIKNHKQGGNIVSHQARRWQQDCPVIGRFQRQQSK